MLKNELFRLGALALETDGTYTPFSGDAIKYALEMTLLGMGMIFAVLGVLWGVLAIFKLVFARPKKEKKAVEVKSEEKAEPTVEAVPVPVETTDDGELIAILTAAIYAYESENNPEAPVGNFRVVSYRRANGGRSWNAK
jgi:sodium pump decarboxylase gamma subunit